MPIINPTGVPTRLTDLTVNEVSLVSKGAIGEIFTILKSGEESDVAKSEQVIPLIQAMSDTQFVAVMQDMMGRYEQINKNEEGGHNMDENQVTELVTSIVAEVIGKSMETVNSNFSKINKSIDEITKKFPPATDGELTDEEKAKAKAKADGEEVKKAIGEIGSVVKSLADTISVIGKSVEGITGISETVKKMAEETLPAIAGRVETIEKQENKPNGVPAGSEDGKVPVTKSGSMWPSFVSSVE